MIYKKRRQTWTFGYLSCPSIVQETGHPTSGGSGSAVNKVVLHNKKNKRTTF